MQRLAVGMFLPDRLHQCSHEWFVVIVAQNAALQMIIVVKDIFQFMDPITQVTMLVTGPLGIQIDIIETDEHKRGRFLHLGIMQIHRHGEEEVFLPVLKFILVNMISTLAFKHIHQLHERILMRLDRAFVDRHTKDVVGLMNVMYLHTGKGTDLTQIFTTPN